MATTHSIPPPRLDQPLRPERLLEKGSSRRIVQHAQSSRKKLTPSESYLILHPSMERSSFNESDDSSSLDDASDDKMSFSEDVVASLASLDDIPPPRLDQPLRPERLLEKGSSRRIVQHAQSSRKKVTPSERFFILQSRGRRSTTAMTRRRWMMCRTTRCPSRKTLWRRSHHWTTVYFHHHRQGLLLGRAVAAELQQSPTRSRDDGWLAMRSVLK